VLARGLNRTTDTEFSVRVPAAPGIAHGYPICRQGPVDDPSYWGAPLL
jgi:hypothetical protein